MSSISKTLTRALSSSLYHSRSANLSTQKWLISQQIRSYAAAVNGKFDGRGKETPFKEIETQREDSNSVNLVGFVDQNVQFNSHSDGKFWAGTVLSQRCGSKSSNFGIPIIFEGDLAETAIQRVKKDDRIQVSGKLFIDTPPPNVTFPQSNVQIMVQNIGFVEAAMSPPEEEEISIKKQPSRSKNSKVVDEETSNSWKDLLENPNDWFDYRGNIDKGLVKPKHPHFKKKDGSLSLWINKASDWVLPKLRGLEFDVFVPKAKLKHLKGEEYWKDLVENPDKWLDNRSVKTNPKFPDFTHNETKEALWLNTCPTWLLSKLPDQKKNQERPPMANTFSPKQNKKEEFWKDLIQNPDKWWDNRLNKENPKQPDFKHRETNEALWITSSPSWVPSELPPPNAKQERPFMAKTASQPAEKQFKREEFWKDLVQNPDKWWDNRLGKRTAKHPDFKHKETDEALWMSDCPVWALSEPPIKKNQESHVTA